MFYTLKSIQKRDPAAKSKLGIFFLYSGYHALMWHRTASFFYRIKLKGIAKFLSNCCKFFTGVEIHPAATIGEGLFIDHGKGVVIGETAVIGNNCTIYHQVTLGGTGRVKHCKRHPTVGDNVLIGAGAKVLGPVTIGNNAMIGAGSIVLDDVPEGATVTGVKAKVIKIGGERVPSMELNQRVEGDPFTKELAGLREEIEQLKKQLKDKGDE